MACSAGGDADAEAVRYLPAILHVLFEFRGCSVTIVPDRVSSGCSPSEPIELLRDVSGSVASDRVLAVMGPSGAGKSTLLNLLTGAKGPAGSLQTATITLNGLPLSETAFIAHCASFGQHSILWSRLSCQEHLEFALACYQAQPTTRSQRTDIEQLLSTTGLDSCANVWAGTSDVEEGVLMGLSGGQRRRLSLALALAKRPAVLIADEPTSGLDAAAAAAIMKLIGDVSRVAHMATVCTIHQPSASIYAGIDELLLLSRGRTAYCGPAGELDAYLVSLGKPVPVGTGLSEHALDLVSSDFNSDGTVEEMLDAWRARQRAAADEVEPPTATLPLPAPTSRATWLQQVRALAWRQRLLTMRDPREIVHPMIAPIILITGSGLAFWLVLRGGGQLAAFKLIQYMFNTATWVLAYNGVVAKTFSVEKRLLDFEVSEGAYTLWAYAPLKIVYALLLSLLLASWSNLILYAWAADVVYWPGYWSSAALFVVVYATLRLLAMTLSYCLAPALANNVYTLLFILFNIATSGFSIGKEFMVWPMRMIMYINPCFYAYPSLVHNLYSGLTFSGAVNCANVPADYLVTNPSMTEDVYHWADSLLDKYELNATSAKLEAVMGEVGGFISWNEHEVCPSGFQCTTDNFRQQCYGHTGLQVLDTLHPQFGTLSAADTLARDLFSTFAIFFAYACLFLGVLHLFHPARRFAAPATSDPASLLTSEPKPLHAPASKEVSKNVASKEASRRPTACTWGT